jgi:hypothetical protein
MLGKRSTARLAMVATVAAPALALLLSLVRPELMALLGWSAAAGAVHGAWLWHRLRHFTRVEMPERIDGTIMLSLTFILWFCIPPLIVLMRATGS